VHEPYTLAPLAATLTALELAGARSLPLVLSILQCSSMRVLRLTGLSGTAASPELLVQLVRSLPSLQELHVAHLAPALVHQQVRCGLLQPCLSRLAANYASWL
jgi:hypothetical protein